MRALLSALLLLAVPAAAKVKTIEDRVAELGPAARARLKPYFDAAGVPYPPAKMVLLGLKSERRLELYAAGAGGALRYVRAYPFTAASGTLGPKLVQGDKQVPEGIYRVESLNPNSRFHLALRVNYPNAFDRAQGARDGRANLGGDIMIHGNQVSIGCIAIGDRAIEEVFVAAAQTGIARVVILISPVDPRAREMPRPESPSWLRGLYASLARDVRALPKPR